MSEQNDQHRRPKIVVLGGGFAGLAAAHALSSKPVDVTIVDRQNYHLFQPLLYQVATAALESAEIASPIRRIFRHAKNVSVILAEAVSVDVAANTLILRDGSISYDYLIVAAGATHSYFGHDEWEEPAPGLKTIDDAIMIRRRVLIAYEAAEREPDPEVQRDWLTFVIIGGGPTGVELAGAIAEISRRVVERDFHRINEVRVVLLEAGPRVLPAMSPESSENAARQLKRLGVQVMVDSKVIAVDDDGVGYEGGRIGSRTAIWAAGVTASPLGATLGAPLDRAGRVKVNPDLSVPGAPNVFVAGDLVSIQSEGKDVPGLAPAAMQEGRHVAKNVLHAIDGTATAPFRYRDKGVLATIGKGAAVADIGRIRLSGVVAWLAWLTIHILYLIGFRNRFFVLAEWAWVYLRNDRGARLITGGDVEALLERGAHSGDGKGSAESG
ncbi:MAG: NAD(P)/FAD-dependent oxidoreductase [Candidatus Binataceae bacterium]